MSRLARSLDGYPARRRGGTVSGGRSDSTRTRSRCRTRANDPLVSRASTSSPSTTSVASPVAMVRLPSTKVSRAPGASAPAIAAESPAARYTRDGEAQTTNALTGLGAAPAVAPSPAGQSSAATRANRARAE